MKSAATRRWRSSPIRWNWTPLPRRPPHPQQRAQIREQYHIPQDATVACFVGRLGREKSVDVLLRFWAQEMKPQDNMRLLIIGDGPEKEPLEQLAQQLGITDTVVFTGKVLHPRPASVRPHLRHLCHRLPFGHQLHLDAGRDGRRSTGVAAVRRAECRPGHRRGQRLYVPRRCRDGTAPAPDSRYGAGGAAKLKTSVIQSVKNSGAPDPCQLHPDHLLQHLSKTATQKAAAVPPAFLPHCTCPSQVSFLYQSKQKDASDFGRSVFLLSSSFSVILLKKPSFLSPVFTITT